MKVIDCITYNGERELLEIRLNILSPHVDRFVICEAPTTFSGRPKPLYFQQFIEDVKNGKRAVDAKTLDKIKYHVIDENYTKEEKKLAKDSPNTQGAKHWKHEFLQKESIKKALTDLDDEDIVFIGDCDEIWSPEVLNIDTHQKLKLKVYTYHLNNRSSELFWGTLFTNYGKIKGECLNHARTYAPGTMQDYGWHFTSMAPDLRRKLLDSYTEESYATPTVMNNLEYNIDNNKDFLGRNFTYKLDEEDWPPWLKINRERFAHLLK